jgi:hypothetical protein
VSGQLQAPATLPPGKSPQEVGWTSEPVWTIWRSENFLPYRDLNSHPPLVIQPMASHYTDWAILAHISQKVELLIATTQRTSNPKEFLRCSFIYQLSNCHEFCVGQDSMVMLTSVSDRITFVSFYVFFKIGLIFLGVSLSWIGLHFFHVAFCQVKEVKVVLRLNFDQTFHIW